VTVRRAGAYVIFLAVAAYANSIGNGFAYDDNGILPSNPVVTSGDLTGAVTRPWWPLHVEGAGLYRPVTSLSFALEWPLWKGSPLGYHILNVLFHGLVSLLVFGFLLLLLGSVSGALAGGGLFAIHPLHTEAVANVVGRAEIFAAFFFLLACILYWRGRGWEGWTRGLRLLGLGLLYLLSLGSKEIGVTLPGVLLLMEVVGPRLTAEASKPLACRLWREAAVFVFLPVVLMAYLGLRFLALGSVAGEMTAPVFQFYGPGARLFTAIATWAQYLRLNLFPIRLAADYDPGVLFPSEGVDGPVLVGALILLCLGIIVVKAWRRYPLVSLGILWFVVCVLPVSNLFFPTGTLLAERTLYLPSVGLSLVAAGLTGLVLDLRRPWKLMVLISAFVWGAGAFAKTVARNPSWMSTFTVLQTLNAEHPESWRAFRARAEGLERVGDMEAAGQSWDMAVRLAPADYSLLVRAGSFHAHWGSWPTAQEYFQRAIQLWPRLANAYQLLAENLIRRGLGREGNRVALAGLARSGFDPQLWAAVSESYVLKGDLAAAARARRAAAENDPTDPAQWRRLGEILSALGDADGAKAAQDRALALTATSEPVGEPPQGLELGTRAAPPGGMGGAG